MKVTNNSKAVQGIHTLHGVAFIQPGDSRDDLALTLSQALRADRLPFIELEGDPVEDLAPSLSASPGGQEGVYIPASEFNGMREAFDGLRNENATLRRRIAELEGNGGQQPKTIDEVLALAEDGTHFKTFESEAKKILGEATPGTKDEIIAALKAKQGA